MKDDVISLNPRSGERAMLIKTNEGDWGIVVGKWIYFEVGRAGKPRKKIKFSSFSSPSLTIQGRVNKLPA